MGRALQRLLARPSSIDLLRYLVGTSALNDILWSLPRRPCNHLHGVPYRLYTTVAKAHELTEDVNSWSDEVEWRLPVIAKKPLSRAATHQPGHIPPGWILGGHSPPKRWEECLWTSEELELQSDLSRNVSQKQRLIDDPRFRHDMELWAYLLEFRKRRFGNDGVLSFWNAMKSRRLDFPTEGRLAETFWTTFLDLSLKNTKILPNICKYADELFDRSGKTWPRLYVHVMQILMLTGQRLVVAQWHDRLVKRHSPDQVEFLIFARNVVTLRGDLKALKDIYKRLDYRNAYTKIVPTLVDQGDFHGALQMHFFLMDHGDFPANQKIIEALIQFFGVYYPAKAAKLTKSLVKANVPFAPIVTAGLKSNQIISREMMNLIHGEAFHVEPKSYNDKLGARWFATKWLSLDLAINTIHALGIEIIGPLSLQAIALRESDPSGVVCRLDQLRNLGVSIGNSVFSKAVDSFARNNQAEFLRGLLESDQHPDSLEDSRLQESLLAAYARSGDYVQYRRTVALRSVRSANSTSEKHNMTLRNHVTSGDQLAIFTTLEEMRSKNVAVTQSTIRYILRNILPWRRMGHLTRPTLDHLDNIRAAVSVLTIIMKSNGIVPVTSWREIIRRLGMFGKLDDVEKLCLFLSKWYNDDSAFRSQFIGRSSPSLLTQDLYLPPGQVRTSHNLHPLRILFSDSFQRAIIEWGFKHDRIHDVVFTADLGDRAVIGSELPRRHLRGVHLLRQLKQEGVFINIYELRHALINRMVILYGPGASSVVRNRFLKYQNNLALEDMIKQLDQAWGEKIFPRSLDLMEKINSDGERAMARMRKLGTMPILGARDVQYTRSLDSQTDIPKFNQ